MSAERKVVAHCLECDVDFRTKLAADIHAKTNGHVVQEVE